MDPLGNSSIPTPWTSGSSQAQYLQSSIPSSQPGFALTSSQPDFAQTLPFPGFAQTSSQRGFTQTSSQRGFTQTSSQRDFSQTSLQRGFTQTSSQCGFSQTSLQPVFTQTSPQPVFAQTSSQPVFAQTSSQPVFVQTSPQPVFAQISPSPGFAQTSQLPGFTRTSSQPGFAQTSQLPGFTQTSSQPGFTQTSPLPGFAQTSPQRGFTRTSSQHGFTQTSSQPVFAQTLPLAGFPQTSSQPGFTQTSSQPGFTQTSSQPGFTQTSPQVVFAQTSSPPGFARTSSQPGFLQTPPLPGFTQTSPQLGFAKTPSQPDFTQTSPPPGFTHASLLPGFAHTSSQIGFAQTSPSPGIAKTSSQPSFIETSLLPGFAQTSPPPCFTQTSSPPGFAQTSLLPGFALTSALPGSAQASLLSGFVQTSPPPGFAQTSSRPGFAQFSSQPSFAQTLSQPDFTQTSPLSDFPLTLYHFGHMETQHNPRFAPPPAQSGFNPTSRIFGFSPPPAAARSHLSPNKRGFMEIQNSPRFALPPAHSGFNPTPRFSGLFPPPPTASPHLSPNEHGFTRTRSIRRFAPYSVPSALRPAPSESVSTQSPRSCGSVESPTVTPGPVEHSFMQAPDLSGCAPPPAQSGLAPTSPQSRFSQAPSTSGSTSTPSTSISTKRSGATGQGKEGFSFEQLYSNGKVYVFPPAFESKIKDKQWKERLREEMPFDPKEFPFDDASQSGRGRRLEKVEAVKEEGLEKAKSNMKGEDAEYKVIIMIETLLKEATKEDTLPVFVLHNLKAGCSEKDIYIFSRKVGVVIVEVKAADNIQGGHLRKHIEKAVEQLKGARSSVRKKLEGLLKPEGVRLAIALPNLPSDKEGDIRQLAEEVLQKNPDVGVMMGQEAHSYRKWLLVPGVDSEVWYTSGQVDSSDSTFKAAAEKYLSVVHVREPDNVVGQVAEQYKSWLLTQEQMEVRDSTEDLLHIWGPPGAGKTLILLHRARRWLEEGRYVILVCGSVKYDVLKSHLGRAMLRQQEEASSRLRICQYTTDIKEAVKEWGGHNLCIITDELHDVKVFKAMMEAVAAGQVQSCWSADVKDMTAKSKLSARAMQLGWKAAWLEGTIRCPQHVVDLLNRLVVGSRKHSAIKACNIPRPRLLSSHTTVIDHNVHQHCVLRPQNTWQALRSELQCEQCKQELSETMQSQHPVTDTVKDTVTFTDRERWRQWVVLQTGSDYNFGRVITASVLTELHLPCVCEEPVRERLRTVVPVSSLVSRPRDLQSKASSQDDRKTRENELAAWRERVVSGLDKNGRPAVHVVKTAHFRGLEKAGVLLLHFDKDDFDLYQQSQAARTAKLNRHRDQWFQAASRCQGQLVVLIMSPSPARSLLQLPEPPVYHGPLPRPPWYRSVSSDNKAVMEYSPYKDDSDDDEKIDDSSSSDDNDDDDEESAARQ